MLGLQQTVPEREFLSKRRGDNSDHKLEVVMNEILMTDRGNVCIPPFLTNDTLNCYRHYLQHPGATRLYGTISQTVYCPGLRAHCEGITKCCKPCRISKFLRTTYGTLPPKDVDLRPLHNVLTVVIRLQC